jgi:hypothetical protein
MPMILNALLTLFAVSQIFLSFTVHAAQCDPDEARDALKEAKDFAKTQPEKMTKEEEYKLLQLNRDRTDFYEKELSNYKSARGKAGGKVRDTFSKWDDMEVHLKAPNGKMVKAKGYFLKMDNYGSGCDITLTEDFPEFGLKKGDLLPIEFDRQGDLFMTMLKDGKPYTSVDLLEKPKPPAALTELPEKYRAPRPDAPVSTFPRGDLPAEEALFQAQSRMLNINADKYVHFDIPTGRIAPQDAAIIRSEPVRIVKAYTNPGAFKKGYLDLGKADTMIDVMTKDGRVISNIPLKYIQSAYSEK